MPRRDADRNLLFGIVAVQMDFVSRDALLDAMNAWVLAKHRPLGEILVERGALDPADLSVLDAMVARHVARHGDDPERSLSALTPANGLVSELASVPDSEVEASLSRVLSTIDAEEPDPDRTRTVAPSQRSPKERYRVVREHARGGLGIVFLARDSELNREVALKEIKRAYADDPESRSRFLLEAEVTGGLEHPGIVPVYGLGRYADGRPYYAMRFIKGDTLKDAIDRFHAADRPGRDPGERSLEFRKLLGRFLDACNAIDYAHSRGVLHRDIKPRNIMVGRYGETLVVDWGLAKSVARPDRNGPSFEETLRPSSGGDSAETLPHSVLGTPHYMSPEQAAGRLDRLGPASDVYSLGATLYVLLTGKVPFPSANVGEILDRVQKGDFPRPRESNPHVPPALEAVCLKAMSLDPEARYASAAELAAEVERWLADEPVSAHREGPRERAFRWVRRHQAMAAGTGAILITAVVALAGFSLALRAEKSRTERQAAVAMKNFHEARLTLQEFLAIAERDRDPATWPLRKAMLETGIARYEAFLEQSRGVPELQPEIASTNALIAQLSFHVELQRSMLGPLPAPAAPPAPAPPLAPAATADVPISSPDFSDARSYNDRAIDLYGRLVRSSPRDERLRSRLTTCLRLRAELDKTHWTLSQAMKATGRYVIADALSSGLGTGLGANAETFNMIGD